MKAEHLHFSQSAAALRGSPMFEMLARVEELEKQGKHIIHFEIGDPDFNTPKHITKAAIAALEHGETHYANSLGITELREAIADTVFRNHGFRPGNGQVVVAPAISLIYFVTRALVNPGEEVIVANPDYSSYFSAFDFVGVRAIAVPTNEKNQFRLQASDIEKCITPKTRLIILNTPQNPTGAVLSRKDLADIFELISKHNIYVLSGEVYSRIVYDESFHSIATHEQCRERVVILNGFSKTYAMTGWRLGYAIAPEPLIKKVGLMIQTVFSNVPPFIQRAGIAALRGDQGCVTAMVDEYRRRRDFLTTEITRLPGVTAIRPAGAFYLFPNITGTGLTSKQFAKRMLEDGNVAVLPGTDFGSMGEGYVRISFATSTDNLKEGLKRMKVVLES